MAKAISKILPKKTGLKVNGSLWMECDGKHFFGPGPVELLKNIEETGSINKAAKKMKMSYKKAWELIHTLNEQTAKPVVILQSGGENGGGSVITEEAIELIRHHDEMRKRFKIFLENETKYLRKPVSNL
jgi:molybdate transport system regulatory protein